MRISLLILISICWLFSKAQMVYEVSTPGFADIRYCVVDSPIFADLLVFKASNPSFPEIKENRGVWYFCPNQSMADITVCHTDEIQSDLKIYFTNSLIFAQWNNPQKKSLMNPDKYK